MNYTNYNKQYSSQKLGLEYMDAGNKGRVPTAKVVRGSGGVEKNNSWSLILAIFSVFALIAGVIGIAVAFKGKGGKGNAALPDARLEDLVVPDCQVLTVFDTNTTNEELTAGNSKYIQLVFPVCPNQEVFTAFFQAAFIWNLVIDENRITPTRLAQNLNTANCGFQNAFTITTNFVFRKLLIGAEVIPIDDVGNILGQASPCVFDSNDFSTGFPVFGLMQFDEADLDELASEGTLYSVILHEMGHVLGIGTLWSDRGLLQDPIFNGNTINANNFPKFTGADATDEFTALKGGVVQANVPVEDGRRADGSRFFNVAAGQGRGSVDGHWKITDLLNELMVFAINPNDAEHPMSRMTIASLDDLGYSVNLDQAQDFSLLRAKSFRGSSSLSNVDSYENWIYLTDDVHEGWRDRAILTNIPV